MWLRPIGDLFYGDGMLTPAISVLSAVEGLKIFAPQMGAPSFRSRSSSSRSCFSCSAAARQDRPHVRPGDARLVPVAWRARHHRHCARRRAFLLALNPFSAISCSRMRTVAFVSLGSVFLAVTGCEALYADMGHFGPQPIRIAWLISCCRRSSSTISARADCCSQSQIGC